MSYPIIIMYVISVVIWGLRVLEYSPVRVGVKWVLSGGITVYLRVSVLLEATVWN